MLPPIDAPRRMWAGGRLTFHAPLPIRARAVRRSVVSDVKVKDGRSGRLTFVTVRHEVLVDGAVAVTEEQDLVFRGAGNGTPPPAPADPRVAEVRRAVRFDATALFRFSALTFNAHRIHYDAPYANDVEHYPRPVVHGQLIATLMLDRLGSRRQDKRLQRFTFRAQRPLLCDTAFAVEGARPREDGTMELWSRTRDGELTMSATAEFEA